MKKNIIGSVITIVLGLVIAIIGMNGLNWDYKEFSSVQYDEKSVSFSEATSVSSVKIDVPNAEIAFNLGSELKVDYYDNEWVDIEVSYNNGLLSVIDTNKLHYFIGFDYGFIAPKITVTVPNDIFDLDVDTVNGDINLTNMGLKNVEIDCTNGICTLSGVTVSNFDYDGANGRIDADAVIIDGAFDASLTNGSITAKNLKADSVNVETVNGAVILSNVDCDNVDVDTVNGQIKASVIGNQSDYNIYVSTITGNGKENQTVPGSSKKVSCTTVNGSVNLSFIEIEVVE